MQSPAVALFLTPNHRNQARTHLRGRHLTARNPKILCPASPLPSQAVPSPRSLRSGPMRLALGFTCRFGSPTHLLHSPKHPIGVTRGEMGQHSGTINAFPEKGVMLQGKQRQARCLYQPPCPTALKHSPSSPGVPKKKSVLVPEPVSHELAPRSASQGSQTDLPHKGVYRERFNHLNAELVH